MFDRARLKNAAKHRLSQNRWMAVLVCLIATALGATGTSLGGFSFPSSWNFDASSEADFSSFDALEPAVVALISLLTVLVVGAVILGIAGAVCVSNVVNSGFMGWFLGFSRGDNPSVVKMFAGFLHYKSTVLGMLLRDVYVLLWSLLLVIPGIVKAYSYAMVPYILRENPSLSPKQALAVSETMMDGWKWEHFKFDLSFFGWHVLNLFTCGILSVLYVMPYYCTSHAMLYDNIKYDAVYVRGTVNASLLNMPLYLNEDPVMVQD